MRIQELREQRSARVMEMRGLVDTADREGRDLADNERTRFDELRAQVTGLEGQIQRAEQLAEFERRLEGAEPVTRNGGLGDLERRYSLGRAISDLMSGGKLTGVEAEWTAEHRRERRGAGMYLSVPTSVLIPENRAVLTTAPSGGPGGNLIQTTVGPMIDIPRPQLVTAAAGATVLTGLTDNLTLPRQKTSGTVTWVGEHQNVAKTDPSFDAVSLSPHTCGATYEVSRRMLEQAPQIEQILRNDLGAVIAGAVDYAALAGTGTSGAPKGVSSTPGVLKVSPSTAFAGAWPTVAELDALFGTMMSLPEQSNLRGNPAWIGSPKLKATYGRYRDGNGNVLYSTLFGDAPVYYSSQIPTNIGTGGNLTRMYYTSDASTLILAYWSSIDLLINPYHPDVAFNGGALIHGFIDVDVGNRHPEAWTFTEAVPINQATTAAVS